MKRLGVLLINNMPMQSTSRGQNRRNRPQ